MLFYASTMAQGDVVLAKEDQSTAPQFNKVMEPSTSLQFVSRDGGQRLVGTSHRPWDYFWKMYAVGLYLSEDGKKELSSFLAFSPSQWDSRADDFFKAMIDGTFRKSLRLIFCNEVCMRNLVFKPSLVLQAPKVLGSFDTMYAQCEITTL